MVPTPWWRVRRSLEAATPALLLLLLLATSLAIALASAALYRCLLLPLLPGQDST